MVKTKIFENKVALLELDEECQKLIVTPLYYDENFMQASIYLIACLENEVELKYQFFLKWVEIMSNEHKEVFEQILEHLNVRKESGNER